MSTLDFTAPRVDLKLKAGTDAIFTCTFAASIAGWSGWDAAVISKSGTEYALAVDTSAQASQQITLSLTDAQTAVITAGAQWQFTALDADGNLTPLVKGRVVVEEDYQA